MNETPILNRTRVALKKCNKILLVGKENDIYKVVFVADDYRYVTFNLKFTILYNPKMTFFPQKERDYNYMKSLSLTKEYSRADALKKLTECNYPKEIQPEDDTFKLVLELLN
jgi:hypothetical protein